MIFYGIFKQTASKLKRTPKNAIMKTKKPFTFIKAATLTLATLSLLAWITPSNYYQGAADNDLIKSIKKR